MILKDEAKGKWVNGVLKQKFYNGIYIINSIYKMESHSTENSINKATCNSINESLEYNI